MPDAETALKAALAGLGVPVARLRYTGQANAFLTYQLVTGLDRAFADDESEAEEWVYRVDIYARKNFIPLLRRTKAALKGAGFFGIVIDPEAYEPDTKFFHVPMAAHYMMEV